MGPNWEQAANILTAIDKMDRLGVRFRMNYDRLSEYAHPNRAGGMGSFERIDRENFTLYYGEEKVKEPNLCMIGHLLIGTQGAFEYFYNSLGDSIHAINEGFENGSFE